MKSSLFALLAVFALGLGAPTYADMVIVQKVDGAGQSGEMTMKIKGDKVRTEVNPQISTITNASTGDVTTVMHEQKSYMTIPASSTKALMEQMQKTMAAQGGASPAAPKLQATGKKETINGQETQEYTSTVGGMKMSYWIAPNYPNWRALLDSMMKFQSGGLAEMTKGMMPDAADFPGMPIRTEVNMNGQKITTTLVSVKEEPVEASLFEIPAGYTEMKMPAFNMPPPQE